MIEVIAQIDLNNIFNIWTIVSDSLGAGLGILGLLLTLALL
jgi:hypothetical protein